MHKRVDGKRVEKQVTKVEILTTNFGEEEKDKASGFIPVMMLVRDHSEPDKEDKLHFNAPTAVLAMLARGAKDSGLILNRQTQGMLRTVAAFCKSKYSGKISVRSLSNHHYEATRSAKQKAIDILQEMIKRIHKY